MNIDFNILWFEDKEEWYTGIKEEIEDYIESLCFIPKIVYLKSIFDPDLEKTIQETNFDLIFADLNLNQSDTRNDKGSEAILLMRKNNILADVLFYSTDGIDKIQSIMKSDIFEGVYTSVRDDILFPDKAKQLIDKAVKRAEDFLNIRGMVMDNVSEFDEKLKDVIRRYLSISDPKGQEELNCYAYKKVNNQLEQTVKNVKEIKTDFIINSLDNSFLLDSYKLSQIVNKIFKEKYSTYEPMKDFHKKYDKFILKERNKLAHAKKESEANGVFYFTDKDGNKTIYDSDKCREIRYNVNSYSKLLDNAFDVIK